MSCFNVLTNIGLVGCCIISNMKAYLYLEFDV